MDAYWENQIRFYGPTNESSSCIAAIIDNLTVFNALFGIATEERQVFPIVLLTVSLD